LPQNGADGLVPISTLPADYYDHDAARHRLVGRRTGRVFALGDTVDATLVEADTIGGRMVFRLDDYSASRTAAPVQPRGGRPRRGYLRRR
jgi:ribonuclease R